MSVVLFVVIPLVSAMLTRRLVIKSKGLAFFENVFLKKFTSTTISGLLLTLIIIFSFQGDVILKNPANILLIAIPLIIQTFLIFAIAYGWAYKWKLPHEIAAPASMIGASNFFELSVAVAIVLFGLNSGATLVTVVGVLVEVPVMLTLVKIANKTKEKFR
jgi:ACR3 family arsenite transporter